MWSDIIGHTRQIDELKQSLSLKRLPQGYLFTGPRGVGKRMVADALAGAVVCVRRPEVGADACGECSGCRKVISRTHPDFFVVLPEVYDPDFKPQGKDRKPSEDIKIEQIRNLQAMLRFHPFEAGSKIAIIDEGDKMTLAASNSLLKTLEEPPPNTHFIIISTQPHLILATIRSRCSLLTFQPIPEGDVARVLIAKRGLSDADATMIARLSGGSLGTALTIEPDFVTDILGRFAAISQKGNSADIMETAEAWSHYETHQTRLIFDILASWYRDLFRFFSTQDKSKLIYPETGTASIRTSPSQVERALSEIALARRAIDTTANKQLMFEDLLFTLTA